MTRFALAIRVGRRRFTHFNQQNYVAVSQIEVAESQVALKPDLVATEPA